MHRGTNLAKIPQCRNRVPRDFPSSSCRSCREGRTPANTLLRPLQYASTTFFQVEGIVCRSWGVDHADKGEGSPSPCPGDGKDTMIPIVVDLSPLPKQDLPELSINTTLLSSWSSPRHDGGPNHDAHQSQPSFVVLPPESQVSTVCGVGRTAGCIPVVSPPGDAESMVNRRRGTPRLGAPDSANPEIRKQIVLCSASARRQSVLRSFPVHHLPTRGPSQPVDDHPICFISDERGITVSAKQRTCWSAPQVHSSLQAREVRPPPVLEDKLQGRSKKGRTALLDGRDIETPLGRSKEGGRRRRRQALQAANAALLLFLDLDARASRVEHE
ncbi:hypothetical protein BDK51DRAFT_46535 [Blyttiomyces helicus]|uniref:Uncharacterized protein n=1 Tax=Blyttiomyces helicus TaxID=388810 RepID=A0A4V1IRI0_9FUNG|nr:hypothetical protein BDK51DRAFT_46535 [Blyttiomyces helicus]|eukprot:RKO90127.1 hypothetical protein BDK51DRAFT_46535 [Blyttiomyces helicus]